LLLIFPHEAKWTPFRTQFYSENLSAPGTEAGTCGSAVRNSDHQSTGAVYHEETSKYYRISKDINSLTKEKLSYVKA
jgi:hypothetical protein